MSKSEFEPKPLSGIFGEAELEQGLSSTVETAPSPEPAAAEKTPEAEVKQEAAVEAAQEKPKEAKAEEKPAEVKAEEKKETKQADPWESAENPYKKRYEDTRKWATSVQSLNKQLEAMAKKQEVVEKKIDGTYDPEKDAIRITPSAEESEFIGRFNASLDLAVEEHGAELINQKIAEWNERFGNNQIAQLRLRAAPNPIHEGLKILNEQAWAQKWGGEKPAPEAIEAAIRADEAAKWQTTLEERVNKAIEERFKKVSEQPKTLSGVKGAANTREAPAFQPKPLSQFFNS